MCCYAGQSVGSVQPAGEIVAELAGGAETLLTTMAAHIVRSRGKQTGTGAGGLILRAPTRQYA